MEYKQGDKVKYKWLYGTSVDAVILKTKKYMFFWTKYLIEYKYGTTVIDSDGMKTSTGSATVRVRGSQLNDKSTK